MDQVTTTHDEAFLLNATQQARGAGHPFPEYAACEAALESAWGLSSLAIKGNNLFGRKQSTPPIYKTLDLPTKEILHGDEITVLAHWVSYPTRADCFFDRVQVLKRLAITHPHYAAALMATDGTTFIREVSQTWSTDPHRADKVLAIYRTHEKLFSTMTSTGTSTSTSSATGGV